MNPTPPQVDDSSSKDVDRQIDEILRYNASGRLKTTPKDAELYTQFGLEQVKKQIKDLITKAQIDTLNTIKIRAEEIVIANNSEPYTYAVTQAFSEAINNERSDHAL